jgi:dipeptide/tripeptide permease
MKAALPLSGAVLASLICIVTGEGFLEPVVACLAMGTLLGRVAERDSA